MFISFVPMVNATYLTYNMQEIKKPIRDIIKDFLYKLLSSMYSISVRKSTPCANNCIAYPDSNGKFFNNKSLHIEN